MPELTANQCVAYGLMRIRKALNLTQEQAAERLEPHIGARWSKTVWSAAESSYRGKRIRRFTASEIAAFAAAFDVPAEYFFRQPRVDVPVSVGGYHNTSEFLQYVQKISREAADKVAMARNGMVPELTFEYASQAPDWPSDTKPSIANLSIDGQHRDPESEYVRDYVGNRRMHGWKVFRRRVTVITGWEEVDEA